MDKQLEDDLCLSHAFMNALSASYRGFYVYVNAMEQLAPSAETNHAAQKIATLIETINGWWEDFKAHRPLMRFSAPPPLAGDAVQAWNLLEVARERLGGIVGELTAVSTVDGLMANPRALYSRVAIDCEAAYSRHHFIQGLILYGRILDKPDVSDRWLQHTLSCQQGINEANALLEKTKRMNGKLLLETVSEILDYTLAGPVACAQKIVDMSRIFTLFSGEFDYHHAGIRSHEVESWADRGIPPYAAGQWCAAGLNPDQVMAWISVGIADPLAVINFLWRGFDLQTAKAWWEGGFQGRFAAAWRDAGHTLEEAVAWRAQGVGHPSLAGVEST